MNEYTKQFKDFTAEVEFGVEIIAHSGPNGQPAVIATSVQEYYDADEIACEQHWHNQLDSEGLELLVTVEDIFNGKGIDDLIEIQVYESFVNGNFKQCFAQYDNLFDKEEFIDWVIDSGVEEKDQSRFLRALLLH